LGKFYGYVCGIVVLLWGLDRINVGISLGAFDAILMGVFWLNQKLGVGFVGMWLEDIIVDIDGNPNLDLRVIN
jgi:hypothetical protein